MTAPERGSHPCTTQITMVQHADGDPSEDLRLINILERDGGREFLDAVEETVGPASLEIDPRAHL